MSASKRNDVSQLIRLAYKNGFINGETCFHCLIEISLFNLGK